MSIETGVARKHRDTVAENLDSEAIIAGLEGRPIERDGLRALGQNRRARDFLQRIRSTESTRTPDNLLHNIKARFQKLRRRIFYVIDGRDTIQARPIVLYF